MLVFECNEPVGEFCSRGNKASITDNGLFDITLTLHGFNGDIAYSLSLTGSQPLGPVGDLIYELVFVSEGE